MVLLAGMLRAEIIGTEERTIPVTVADVIDAWRASEEGPCARCGARTHIYGPGGNPLCADCRPVMTEARTGQDYPLTRASAAARRDAA
jgi:hypothetical protein